MAEQSKIKDYSKGLIYTIKTDNGLYVGSTIDFKKRKGTHKSNIYNENSHEYNYKLYQNIRENGCDLNMEIYKLFPCENDIELRQEEERIRIELNANLNERRAYVTEEGKKEYQKEHFKEYYNKNKNRLLAQQGEKITCECGCKTRRSDIARHRKSKKHLKLMEELVL